MVMEERLHRRDVLEQSLRDVCVLTHKAIRNNVLGRGSSVSKITETLNTLQNHRICK